MEALRGLSYGSYLNLDKLLSAQKPLSECPDEMLFIVIHQVTELWMKLSLHELTGVLRQVQSDELNPAFKMLSRVARIQGQLILSWKTVERIIGHKRGTGGTSGASYLQKALRLQFFPELWSVRTAI